MKGARVPRKSRRLPQTAARGTREVAAARSLHLRHRRHPRTRCYRNASAARNYDTPCVTWRPRTCGTSSTIWGRRWSSPSPEGKFLNSILPLYSGFNCMFYTGCTCVFHKMLTINIYYFSYTALTGLYNSGMCSLGGRSWSFMHKLC